MLHPPAHGTPGFNGATAFRQWKRHPRSLWSSVRATRFNGATAFRQWKPSNVAVMRLRPCSVLQWGHHLSAVETSAAYPAGHRRLRASMGPPPFGSGNRGVRRHVAPLRRASMGPPPFGSGNRGVRRHVAPLRRASMGPPPFGSGNNDDIPGESRSGWELQWGHRLSAVETVAPFYNLFPRMFASMGPPPFGSGNQGWLRNTHFHLSRFNGATAFRQWKPGLWRIISRVRWTLLQWGHRLSAVETA